MTDVLTEHFAALADTTDDSDWLDVRRRTKHGRRRYVLPIAAAAAATFVAVAIAAGGGWLFTKNHNGFVSGMTHVQFHGKIWTVRADVVNARSFCLLLLPADRTRVNYFVAEGCGTSTLTAKGVPQGLLPTRAPTGPAFGALNFDRGHGQLWFGDTRPTVAVIAITDTHGKVYRTRTVAPSNLRTTFRMWLIALPTSTGRTIAGYDSHGKLVEERPIYGLGSFNLH